MIGLDEFRSNMLSIIENEKKQKSIYLKGDNLEDLLREASIQLGTSIKNLNYEVLQKGRKGFLGIGASEWSLLIYEEDSAFYEKSLIPFSHNQDFISHEELTINESGNFFIRLTNEILLKVTPPQGNGQAISLAEVIQALQEKNITEYDEKFLQTIINNCEGTYFSLGKRKNFDPSQNAIMSIERTENNMEAYLKVSPPGEKGAEILPSDIKLLLKRQGISDKAILTKEIDSFVDRPLYNQSYLIAKGLPSVNGESGKVNFFYKNDKDKKFKESIYGKIDFKEISSVQNVKKGDVLAEIISPTEGKDGYDLDGRVLVAQRGEDPNFILGNNVVLSQDGKQLISSIDGYIIFKDRSLSVENIYIIEGDVGLKTGNIYNNGSVLVKGNVLDGYIIKTEGNLEIIGSVGKAKLISAADVVLHLGANGNHDAIIESGGNVWAKFIENCTVRAQKNVFVSDGILYSNVGAGESVICQGKRAKIVGGHIIAKEEVISQDIGAVGNAGTIVEVGLEPKDVELTISFEEWQEKLDHELEELSKNIQSFEKQHGTNVNLTSKKGMILKSFKEDFRIISQERNLVREELSKIEERLKTHKGEGKVSVIGAAYPGITIKINGTIMELSYEIFKVTFLEDEGRIKTIPVDYKENKEMLEKPSVSMTK